MRDYLNLFLDRSKKDLQIGLGVTSSNFMQKNCRIAFNFPKDQSASLFLDTNKIIGDKTLDKYGVTDGCEITMKKCEKRMMVFIFLKTITNFIFREFPY